MEIIAKTKDGVLINASKEEVEEILNAVTGEKPKELNVGMKIPAIDYASTIRKVKSLAKDFAFKQLTEYAMKFYNEVNTLKNVVDAASKIDLDNP